MFAIVTSFTPGPNNMMVLVSGVNFGFWRSLPHMIGISVGFPVMILAIGFGIASLFSAYPMLYDVLKWTSIAYMLWLAWKIANAGPMTKEAAEASRPMRFYEAALFQWVNPKAWAMALTGVAAYTLPGAFALSLSIMALVFFLICLPSVAAWNGFGVGLRQILQDPRRVRVFNIVMAVLLVLSLVPVVMGLH
jgi:threonine/homoserine/homoserine lactone efflux protein